ncbi:MAG: heavy-metal-associated domain-containing protein, partial [Melioribacteraceae bacterium]|nr:heavy-metal-associated domain-containing protein [Melioribacteraceae bacterium]
MKKYSFPVEGMTCASCVARVEKIVKKFENVKNVNVNLANETLTFEAEEKIDLNSIAKEIEDYGYKLKIDHIKSTSQKISSSKDDFKDEFFEKLKTDF